jgi:hypothetical protein
MWRHVALVRTDVSEVSLFHHQGEKSQRATNVSSNYQLKHTAKNHRKYRSVFQLPVTASAVPRSLILSTLMMEAICSSETSVLTRTIRRHIPEDGILQSHHRENLHPFKKSSSNKSLRLTAALHHGIISNFLLLHIFRPECCHSHHLTDFFLSSSRRV